MAPPAMPGNAPWEEPSPDSPPRGDFVDAPERAEGGPEVTDVTKVSLTPARQRLVEVMQEIRYGRLEGLEVRGP